MTKTIILDCNEIIRALHIFMEGELISNLFSSLAPGGVFDQPCAQDHPDSGETPAEKSCP